ncbi:MAG: hypothetical protein ACI38A_01845 [Candidatus Ornithomonoglobus sp.]
MENEAYVAPECAKKVVNYFCNCIKFEMDIRHTGGMRDTLNMMARRLSDFSDAHTKAMDIRPVEGDWRIFEPFANKRTRIPYHLWHWLYAFYGRTVDFNNNINSKPLDIYDKLKLEFIEHYRFCKQDEKETAQILKRERRKFSKLARDGRYNYTISLRDKSFSEIFTDEEFDKAYIIFCNLFFKQFYDKCHDNY